MFPGLGLALALAQDPTLRPEEVRDRIERNFPRLQGARAEIEAARGRLRSRVGAFDPIFSLDTSHLRYNSSSNRGKAYATEMTEGTVEVLTRSGISVFAGSRLNLGDVKSPNSSTGSLGEYFIGLKLPLLRGNGLNDQSVAERQARIGIDVADRDVALLRLASLRGGLAAYYQWIGASQRRTIVVRLLEIARTRSEQIRRRVDVQDAPQAEFVEIQTEVRRREGDLARADRQLANAGYTLGLYLWDAAGTPATLQEAPPSDPNAPVPLPPGATDALTAAALKRRPEVEALELSREAVQLSLDFARNDRKPRLDLVISPGLDTGRDSIGSTSKLGVFYSIPLVQNTVDGRIDEARQRLRKIDLDRNFLNQQIRNEVADAVNGVEQTYLRYEAARQEVDLAAELERMERIRYEAGEGTLFLLIQRERATAEARARLVDVIADYQLAQVVLRAATAEL